MLCDSRRAEVDSFKQGQFSKTQCGTMIIPEEGEDVSAMRLRRARHMVKKYIENDSRMEVNIETALKERTVERVESNLSVYSFDEAQGEILKLLDQNLFQNFRKTKSYTDMVEKEKAKLQRKLSQGTVNKRVP